jgi:hypothetical protein
MAAGNRTSLPMPMMLPSATGKTFGSLGRSIRLLAKEIPGEACPDNQEFPTTLPSYAIAELQQK